MDVLSELPEIDERARYAALLAEVRDLHTACAQAPGVMRMALGPGGRLSEIRLWLCPPAGPLEGLWAEFAIRVPWLHCAGAGRGSLSDVPPAVVSRSRLLHPNVARDGRVCLGLRRPDGAEQPVSLLGAANILLCLLVEPENGAEDAVDLLAARLVASGRYREASRRWLLEGVGIGDGGSG